MKRSGKVGAFAYAQLVKALQEGPYSRAELAEITGLHTQTVGHYVDELRRAGQVFIAAWDQPADGGRNLVACYQLGQMKDVTRPKMSEAQRTAACRARKLQGLVAWPGGVHA